MTFGPKRRTEAEFWAMLSPSNERGCRLWPRAGGRGGYGKTYWQGRPLSAHQVAFLLTHGWCPQGRETIIRHTCDTPLCCEPSHLIVGTQRDNAQDREQRGRSNRRPSWAAANAACTPEQVREIRARHERGESYTQLARAFGLHPQNIGRICRREGYKDVA
jgi:hypothetical protein